MQLVILLPTMGKVHTRFMTSLIGLTQSLQRNGIPFAVKHYEFSDLVMSRNYLVSFFLTQKRFTHALLLDSDLEFAPSQFYRLKDFGEDFTAAVYPDRRVTGMVLKAAMQDATEKDLATTQGVSALLSRHMRYLTSNHISKTKTVKPEKRDGFMSVASAGTGFMLISRAVVEGIVESGHGRPLTRTGQLPIYADAHQFTDFFSHHLTQEEDAFYGEDQSFCRRWILGCGGKVWVDRASKVGHIGEFEYSGDFSMQSGILDEE